MWIACFLRGHTLIVRVVPVCLRTAHHTRNLLLQRPSALVIGLSAAKGHRVLATCKALSTLSRNFSENIAIMSLVDCVPEALVLRGHEVLDLGDEAVSVRIKIARAFDFKSLVLNDPLCDATE